VLRWRHARTALQLVLLLIAAVMVLHGLLGPRLAPANLATVLTWVHYRGLLIVALLAVGNLFCTGCPFILVRDAARRLHTPAARWPRWLRRKWPALVLFVAVLFVYELFDLWSLPRATAWLVLGYFGAALAVDLVFSGASFCKYICPSGSSTSSSRRSRRSSCACASRPSAAPAGRWTASRGGARRRRRCRFSGAAASWTSSCQPRSATSIAPCASTACRPARTTTSRWPRACRVSNSPRGGAGPALARLAQRWDLAALAAVFVFGALLNALGMIAPVYVLERTIGAWLGTAAEAPVLAVLFVLALVIAPAILLGGAAWISSRAAGAPQGGRKTALYVRTFVYALVPFGAGVWAAHYGFHLLTGALTIVPVTQSAVVDLAGRAWLGAPRWTWVGLPSWRRAAASGRAARAGDDRLPGLGLADRRA
jgi:hypothetical protein